MDAAPRRVSGVILAAGTSSRLGRPKQLLDLAGEPLLRRVVQAAVASGLGEVIVVLGSRAGDISAAIGELGQRTVVNERFGEGQSTSVVMGLRAMSPETDGVMFLLGDQVLVSTEAIDRLVGRFGEGETRIAQAAYGGVPGNPVVFGRALFPELLTVTGDEGARSVVRRHRDEVELVEVGDVAEQLDVDTEEDYVRLLRRWTDRA